MSKHTKGPWRISGYNENMGYPEPVIAGMVNGCTAYVAVCIDCQGMTEANARLIAAAPCILEALEAMCAEFRGYDLPYGSEAYAKAISAINKTRSAS